MAEGRNINYIKMDNELRDGPLLQSPNYAPIYFSCKTLLASLIFFNLLMPQSNCSSQKGS
jgi:hypothetical protein